MGDLRMSRAEKRRDFWCDKFLIELMIVYGLLAFLFFAMVPSTLLGIETPKTDHQVAIGAPFSWLNSLLSVIPFLMFFRNPEALDTMFALFSVGMAILCFLVRSAYQGNKPNRRSLVVLLISLSGAFVGFYTQMAFYDGIVNGLSSISRLSFRYLPTVVDVFLFLAWVAYAVGTVYFFNKMNPNKVMKVRKNIFKKSK